MSDEEAKQAVTRICAEHRLEGEARRYDAGSVPVFAVGGEHVVKLFPNDEVAFFEREHAALARIDGAISVPTPRVVAVGETAGWCYVVMSQLPGRSLASAWPQIEPDERERLVRAVAHALRELHALPTADLSSHALDWSAFVAVQRASAVERQREKGLASPWVEQIDDFLARHAPIDDGRRALLHTEVMREHLLVEPTSSGWRLTGLVDFEPSMVGAPAYDLASVGVFVTCAEPGLWAAFSEAYGERVAPETVMAYALLHRYSNLRWYLERLPVPAGVSDLESLARLWFDAGH